MWCTSRASPASAMSPTRVRVRSLTRCWCTAPVSSSDGIGAQSASTPRLDSTISRAPSSIAAETSALISSRRRQQPGAALGRRERAPDGVGGEAGVVPVVVDVDDLRELLVAEHRERQDDLAAARRTGREQVLLRADLALQRGDQLLADRVQRRIGHLGEQLGEVVVERAGRSEMKASAASLPIEPIGSAPARHRLEDDAQLLLGVAERLLPLAQLGRGEDLALAGGQVVEVHQAGVQPVRVRVLRGQCALDLGVVDDPPGLGVDQEHPARLQPALADHRRRGHVEHADLGRQHDQPVLGDPPARGPQAVAVEHRTDHVAVGEGDQRGAVPRLHQRGVELVEGPARRVHLGVVLPRLRDHHQHRVRQAAPAEVQQLEHLVEGRRVAGVGRDDRGQPLQVAGQQVRRQQRLAGRHPVAVAAQGVDLPVVRDVAVRVSQRPGRERVRGEPGVHQRQRAGHALVGEVGVERLELRLGEHALVDDRARRERGEVGADLVLGALAQAVGTPLQRDPRGTAVLPRRPRRTAAGRRASPRGRWGRFRPSRRPSAAPASRAPAGSPRRPAPRSARRPTPPSRLGRQEGGATA